MLWNRSLAWFCSLLGKNSTNSGILTDKPIRAAATSGAAAAAVAGAATAAVAGATSVSFED